MKMEDMSLSGLDNSKLEAIAHEIYTELVEDACLGLCFEVHRAVKCGYFFLDDTDPDSMKDFAWFLPGAPLVPPHQFTPPRRISREPWVLCPPCLAGCWGLLSGPLGAGEDGRCRMDGPGVLGRRIASSNNLNKSESDQEDNDDINDNDWSYGSEKKAKKRKSDKDAPNTPLSLQNPNSPRRSKSLKHKNAPPTLTLLSAPQYSNSAGINYETLGPEELRTLLTTQCGVISEHTKKMCTRSLRCPQHTDEQRRAVRVYLLGPSASLPEAEGGVENDSFEVAESQALMSRLQWDGSSDISPSDSASSKASTNNSESRKTKKKKPHLGLVSGAPGLGSSKKKKPKPPAPHTPSIYDDIN
ncbi:Ataxin-7-like 3 [Corvus brachyrhynchos]|uniref:Ataxin-7-like 3 n=1 Tax=Corvus brachyrhynchos TaxID=85066 RepID=A0A091F2L9_CORBR|nr:Ataxin-7-like 3 [Corvus brachyrhynchos]